MNFLKKNYKLLIGFLVGTILTGGIAYAVTSASSISYIKPGTETQISVETALNELYGKQTVVECIWNSTDNLVNPKSSLSLEKTIEHSGTFIVDIAAVEGNATLSNKWTYNLKVNNVTVSTEDGFCNNWNGHYYYVVKVKTGDVVTLYSGVDYTSNYNAVSVGGYLVY